MIPARNLALCALLCPKSVPVFMSESQTLVDLLKRKSKKELKSLCDVSDNLSSHVEGLYKNFITCSSSDAASLDSSYFSQAALAFNGPAFQGLDANSLNSDQGSSLQKRLRILTGLYGPVRPGDMIQEHRLCMSTKLAVDKDRKDLYAFWGQSIASQILHDIDTQLNEIELMSGDRPSPVIINCASQEYFKAVGRYLQEHGITVIECVFLDGGMVKSAYAKRARGLMARYVCANGAIISALDVDRIKGFDSEGYVYSADQSTDTTLVFTRTPAAAAAHALKVKSNASKSKILTDIKEKGAVVGKKNVSSGTSGATSHESNDKEGSATSTKKRGVKKEATAIIKLPNDPPSKRRRVSRK
jgi:uncharacterized protein